MPGQGVRITAGLTLAGGLGMPWGLGLNKPCIYGGFSGNFMGTITFYGIGSGVSFWDHFQSFNCQLWRHCQLRGLVPGLCAESGAPRGDGGDEFLRGALRVAALLRAEDTLW